MINRYANSFPCLVLAGICFVAQPLRADIPVAGAAPDSAPNGSTQQQANLAAAQAPVKPAVIEMPEAQDLSTGGKVKLVELKRTSGDTVTLKFQLINDGKGKLSKDVFGGNTTGWNTSQVTLLDMQNKKKYLVMRDSEDHPLTSYGNYQNHEVEAGAVVNFWAKFQAPPTSVTKVTVEIPQAPPFEDIPIS